MNSKQRKTLAAIFDGKPVDYRDAESLLKAVGCVLKQRQGSRVVFARDGLKLLLHKPHPADLLIPPKVRAIRDFLMQLGIET